MRSDSGARSSVVRRRTQHSPGVGSRRASGRDGADPRGARTTARGSSRRRGRCTPRRVRGTDSSPGRDPCHRCGARSHTRRARPWRPRAGPSVSAAHRRPVGLGRRARVQCAAPPGERDADRDALAFRIGDGSGQQPPGQLVVTLGQADGHLARPSDGTAWRADRRRARDAPAGRAYSTASRPSSASLSRWNLTDVAGDTRTLGDLVPVHRPAVRSRSDRARRSGSPSVAMPETSRSKSAPRAGS